MRQRWSDGGFGGSCGRRRRLPRREASRAPGGSRIDRWACHHFVSLCLGPWLEPRRRSSCSRPRHGIHARARLIQPRRDVPETGRVLWEARAATPKRRQEPRKWAWSHLQHPARERAETARRYHRLEMERPRPRGERAGARHLLVPLDVVRSWYQYGAAHRCWLTEGTSARRQALEPSAALQCTAFLELRDWEEAAAQLWWWLRRRGALHASVNSADFAIRQVTRQLHTKIRPLRGAARSSDVCSPRICGGAAWRHVR